MGTARHILTRWPRALTGLLLPMTLIIAWEVAVRTHCFPPSLSAAPSTICITCAELLWSGELAKHTLLSVLRILVGVSIGTGVGIAMGMVTGQARRAERLISPMLQFIAPVPIVVWMPFAIMLFGTGELYKVSLPILATFLLVHIQTFEGVRNVPQAYLELAEMYEKSRWQKVRNVLLPASLPAILTGLRIALAISWIAIFLAEYSSAEEGLGGLGWFIADAREVGRVESQFAGVLVLGAIGFLSDAGIAMWQKRRLAWAANLETAFSQGEGV